MIDVNIIELEATKVSFYSQNDEAAFFEWLRKISCIENCEGRGLTIYLRVNANAMTEVDLREILSIFRRYEISMQQLSTFDEEKFSAWFRDKRAYWYASVFEGGTS